MSKTFTLDQAGFRLTNLVVELYRSKKAYDHAGDILAEMLLEAGVDVGAKLNCLAQSKLDEDKHKLGKNVLEGLAKVEHLVFVMEEDKIYARKKTKELLDYVVSVREAIHELNHILAKKMEKKMRKSVIVNMPNGANLGLAQPQVAPTNYAYPYDMYGFDEPVEDDE
jgi:hypothetical protein